MKKLTNTLKKMLNGLAAADAGEYLTARQKAAHLENTRVSVVKAPKPAPARKEKTVINTRRRVAMYMGSELPAAMMDYVIDTCVRLDHDLTVLTFATGSLADNLLAPYAEVLEGKGIEMQTIKLSGEPVQGLASYLRGHPEVAFMACKDSGYLGRGFMNGTQSKNALPVPVVVVATDPAAANAQPAAKAEQGSKAGAA